jgi:hypothetical protein
MADAIPERWTVDVPSLVCRPRPPGFSTSELQHASLRRLADRRMMRELGHERDREGNSLRQQDHVATSGAACLTPSG